MDHRTFTTLILQYRSRLDGAVRELIQQHEYEAAAETLSPTNICQSYGMGLDALQEQISGPLRNFDRAAAQLVGHMNQWIEGTRPAHFEYIRTTKNPDFSLQAMLTTRTLRSSSWIW
jgi:hypothetical protein